MFGSATLTLLTLLLLVSLLAHQTPLFLLSLGLLLAAGLSRVWERYCLTGIEYRRHFSRHHAAFGETIELEIEIVNRKILPLAWLEIEDEIPRDLPPARGKVYASHKPMRALLSSLIALRPYERVRRHYPIPCVVRGEHLFGPVRLRSGDLFGLVSREMVREETETLVVYPRVVPLTALGLPAQQPLGDRRTQSWLFEDPSRLAGLREHRPGDSLRRIHWAASAKTQRLQVKVFEPTTVHQLAIFLNVKSTPGGWWGLDYDPDALELAIATTASVSAWGLGEGYQVGLATNGMHRFGRFDVGVAPSSDPAHLPRVLDALARLQPIAVRPFEQTLAQDTHRLGYGATVVVVSAVLSAPVVAQLLALHRRGYPVTLVYTGRQSTAVSLDGVVIRRVGPPEDWRHLPTLSLASE
ncbi:MAG TPA: DUF58 domain-containing protein [Chloroflexota bacterium]|nr:DUF58 domain-containing protein [Chloroflexota bacterium]